MNKVYYEKISKSLDILNKSLAVQEKNTVVLFSYLHNLIQEKDKTIKELSTKIQKLDKELHSKKEIILPWYKKFYNSCYQFIFKKKIERERLERERLEKERLEQEKIRQQEENKRKIKEILKNTKSKK